MTSKERVIKQLNFERTDRIPFNFWMDRRMLAEYERVYGKDFRIRHYDADVIETFPLLDWPVGRGVERDGSFWFTEPLLKDWEDVETLVMPDPFEDKVYENIRSALSRYADKAVFVNIPGPFTVLHGIRLMDNLMLDVYENPDELHRLVKTIMDIQNSVIEKVVSLPITAVYFQDDVACSRGLLFSPGMIKEFIFDYLAEGIGLAKKSGKMVVYHSDGNVTDILDALVQMGVNAVNPFQPEFNPFEDFKEKYHGKLSVYGGIDNTKIIPDGSVRDIERHIREIFNTLGRDGGLIMSSHDIPIHCPHENVETMVSSIKSCTYDI